jgi:hypothetical protein
MIDALLKSQANQQDILQQQRQDHIMVVDSIKQLKPDNVRNVVEPMKNVVNTPAVASPPKSTLTTPNTVTKTPPSSSTTSSSSPVSGKPVGHSHNAKGWEPAVVAHTLENTIKAVTKQKSVLKEKYGEALAKEIFALDSQIAYNGRLRDKTGVCVVVVLLTLKSVCFARQ